MKTTRHADRPAVLMRSILTLLVAVGVFAAGSDCRLDDNNVPDATTGPDIQGSGNIITLNTASGATTPSSPAGVHTVGPIVIATGAIASILPTANFDYRAALDTLG